MAIALLEKDVKIKREELADYISMVDAKATPFCSMAPKEAELDNTYFRWSAAAYDTPKGTAVSVADGTAAANDAASNRSELANYGQVFRRVASVGFLAQAVPNVAGVGKRKEIQWQTARKLVELKRDMEAAFCSTDQVGQADNGTVGYLTKPLSDFIHASGGSAPQVPSGFRTPSASIDTTATASLADTNIQAVLTSIYEQTGVSGSFDLLCGTALKRAFSQLTKAVSTTTGGTNIFTQSAVRTFQMDIATDVYRSSVSVFEGDFGRVQLVPSNFIGTTTTSSGAALVVQNFKGYLIDWDLVAIRYGILPNVSELPNDGSGPRRLIQGFAGLVVKNPLGLGKFNASA